MENKTAEELAKEYVENHPDSEVGRMYGHHVRSFKDGYKASESTISQLQEELSGLKKFPREPRTQLEKHLSLVLVDVQKERNKLQEEIARLRGLFRLNDAWPLKDILKKLIDGTDILLHKKDYDALGWEDYEHAFTRGKVVLQQIESVLSKAKPKQE